MDIIRLISDRSKLLSRGQREVAQYLLENWEKAAYESATAIAHRLGLSQSTIIRTALALGFAGFPELQQELRQFIQYRVSSVNRLDNASETYSSQQGSQDFVARIFELMSDNLQTTYSRLQLEDIEQTVKLLTNADRIFLVGMRSTASVANYLGFNLAMIFKNVYIITDNYQLPEMARTFSAKDVLIAIAFPRYARQAVTTVQAASERSVKIIGITDTLSSPIVDCCDIKFLVSITSSHFNSSPIAAIALADVILSSISINAKQKVRKELQNLETEFERFDMFSR